MSKFTAIKKERKQKTRKREKQNKSLAAPGHNYSKSPLWLSNDIGKCQQSVCLWKQHCDEDGLYFMKEGQLKGRKEERC